MFSHITTPILQLQKEAVEAAAELMIAGNFLVDIVPILKHVPQWFPGARFKRKAATLREHSENIRNAPFLETQKLMVGYSMTISLDFSNHVTTPQANGKYDPSFISDALMQIEHGENPNQDIDLLKDIAGQVYAGGSARFVPPFSSANGALLQPEQIPRLQLLGLSFWRWYAIPRCRRRLKKNLTMSSMEGFPNLAKLCRFHTSRPSSKRYIGTVKLIQGFSTSH